MDTLWKLTKRNINVYARDRMSVFFSFLSVLIIIGLYALFLSRVQLNGIEGGFRGRDIPIPTGIGPLINSWIMAGLLAVNTVTVSLGVLGSMVFDIEYKRFPDFVVAPVSRTTVVLSYLLSSCIISFLFSLIALAAGELYIVSSGGELLSAVSFLKVIGMLALSAASASSVMYLIMTFLKTSSAVGTLSTLLGTLIGFITGIYVPVGELPDAMRKVVDLVPFSHSAAMLRQVFCEQPMAKVFAGAPEYMAGYIKEYGVKLYWNDTELTMGIMVAVLAGMAAVFLLLSALRLRKYKQA